MVAFSSGNLTRLHHDQTHTPYNQHRAHALRANFTQLSHLPISFMTSVLFANACVTFIMPVIQKR